MPRPKRDTRIAVLIQLLIPATTFMGGMAVNAFSIAKKIASVDYVDGKAVEGRKYTDSQIATAMKTSEDKFREAIDHSDQRFREAIDHSDMNRKDMTNAVTAQSADIKTQGAKIEIILDTLRDMQQQRWRDEPPRRRR